MRERYGVAGQPKGRGGGGASRRGPAPKVQQSEASMVVRSRRSSPRFVFKTESQLKAQKYISDMEDGTRTALQYLDLYKKELAKPYSKCGRRYPVEYTGNGKCHLRALHNVNQDAAAEAWQERIKYTNNKGVIDVLCKHKHKQDTKGLVSGKRTTGWRPSQ